MKIVMTETKKGSPDGLKVNTYEKGKTYEIPEELAKVFVEELEVARIFKEEVVKLKTEAKKPKLKTMSKNIKTTFKKS